MGGGVVSFRDRGHLAGRPRFTLQNEGLGQVTGPGWDKPRCDLHTQRILDSHYRDGGSDAFSVIYRRPRMPLAAPDTLSRQVPVDPGGTAALAVWLGPREVG